MVAMASDSYLLKVPQPVCPAQAQGCHGCSSRRGAKERSTSCGVVVTLVLLVAGLLSLASIVYLQRIEVNAMRIMMQSHMTRVNEQLSRIPSTEEMWKMFEQLPHQRDEDYSEDFVDDDGEEDDDTLPAYPEQEDGMIAMNVPSQRVDPSETSSVQPLLPAGGDATVEAPTTPAPAPLQVPTVEDADVYDSDSYSDEFENAGPLTRRRRDVGRPQPQLRLYHTLQEAAAPEEAWRNPGYRREDRPQPMYAERAPIGYVTPPRYPSFATTTPAPIANRRSRVMDGTAAQNYHHRRRHHRLQDPGLQSEHGRHQELQQHHQLHQYPQRRRSSPHRGVRVTHTFHP